uniref:Uncharacterized protein n=1 Tax=Arundo donax TaxID=35708 RepID=A0A0A8YL88_ARUDO
MYASLFCYWHLQHEHCTGSTLVDDHRFCLDENFKGIFLKRYF